MAADAIVVPSAPDPAYLPTLLRMVERHHIGVLVPMADDELPVLSAATAVPQFAAVGCRVVISAPDFISMAADKLATVDFCRRHEIRVPATDTVARLREPMAPPVTRARSRRRARGSVGRGRGRSSGRSSR